MFRSVCLCLLLTVIVACRQGSAEDARGDVALNDRSYVRAIAADTALTAAQHALDAGHAWRATRLLAPVLRDPARRTPAALMLAARAAAGWEGWTEVDRLLKGQPWLGTQFAGAGYDLLARSALERGTDTVSAAVYADSAVRRATDTHARATRLVLLARALDRLNQRDSARATYERASLELRDIKDWLTLRAAGVTNDSVTRTRSFAAIRSAPARERIDWTDALARERAGDLVGAAVRYERLGAMASAFRLRLGPTADSSTRAAIRDSVVRYLRAKGGTADARLAVDVLDHAFPALTPDEELAVARSANAAGPVARALAGYAKGLGSAEATSKDRLDYGELLIRAGKYHDAPAVLERVQSPSNLAAEAAYQRGRAMVLGGNGNGARTALRAVADEYRADTTGAASALYLLGDLATDDSKDDEAVGFFRALYRAYPTSPRADDARFRVGLIAYIKGDGRAAAVQFDSLVRLYPRSSEATAARYWSGRAWLVAGDRTRADAAWRDVIAREPLSYYAATSAKRLNLAPWSPPGGGPAVDRFLRVPAVDSAMRRIVALEQLGMDTEARFEYDALEGAAAATPDRLLATAAALRDHGQTSRAIKLAWKIIDAGTRDARAYRLAYPVIDQSELVRQARARSIEPTLVAAIIRQESSFNPRAVSVAGARGLMQVMPPVGQQIARSLGYPLWDPGLLFDPDANLELGATHLAASIRQYEDLARVLAAYNAGGSRVTRWAAKSGTDDPEIFVERISFTETRDYVRIVERNAEIYRALYSW
ncbi:MAG TPA: transglycosylase SLT domain-containing protein [Gemmatimonadaceae bacterium]|jgi:soluble lytic murein transglycosylase